MIHTVFEQSFYILLTTPDSHQGNPSSTIRSLLDIALGRRLHHNAADVGRAGEGYLYTDIYFESPNAVVEIISFG